MLQAIVDWSIRNRTVVVVLAVLLLVVGIYATLHAPLDVFPEFAQPQVEIQTEAPGLSATEVEQLVTLPIETAINGVPRLDVLRSRSIQGLSVVTVFFTDGTDIYRARQQVAEKLAALAGRLPAGVRAPQLAPLTSTTGHLLTVGFTADPNRLSPMELRDRVQWDIRPRILAIPGVAQVTLFGGEVRQFQVQVHPEALAARHLTVTDVFETARQASGVRGAGFIENANQRLTLRVEGQVRSAADLAETPIAAAEGTVVRLKDVARVAEGPEPKFGDGTVNGEAGVLLILHRQIDGDTAEITKRLEAELESLRPGLERQGIRYHPALLRQATFIEHAVGNVTHSLLIGAVLVAVVLFLFLFNLRTAFISLTAIPLSLLGAVIALRSWGVSLNTITLGGLAIAVGEVVDDAIIDVENIFRRLRENSRLGQPRSAAAVVLSASLEVRSAVVYATFIVVLVFVPIIFLSGIQGRLFAPLGYAYVFAVLVSLGVALTVTPALALVLLPRSGEPRQPPLLRWLQQGYDRLLRRLDGELPLVLAGTVTLFVAAVWAVFQFGAQFLPELRENNFIVHMRGVPGTSLHQSLATGRRVTEALLKNRAVASVAQRAGRAELGEDTQGVEYNEMEVNLQPLGAKEAQQVQREIDKTCQRFAGFAFEALPFLKERMQETISGNPGQVAVKVYGDDLNHLDQAVQTIVNVLSGVPHSQNVISEAQTGSPELVVRPRPQEAARFGLRNGQILDAVSAAFQGATVGQVYDRNRIVDLVVILDPKARRSPETVADMWLAIPSAGAPAAPGGNATTTDEQSNSALAPAVSAGGSRTPARVQLSQVAEVFLNDGRWLVAHEGGVRQEVVTCNVEGSDVQSFVQEAKRRVKKARLPAGISYAFTGENVAMEATHHELALLVPAALVGIVLLLWLAFGSLRRLLLILVNLPFAAVGGVAAIYLRSGLLDVGSLIGFVTLFGITVRNSIMMVSHWQHLCDIESIPWGPELIFRGARERLAPVLMTALVTGLGLLPIALGSGAAGREIEGPMACVILGGLLTSTLLNLVVLPVLYRRFGGGKAGGLLAA